MTQTNQHNKVVLVTGVFDVLHIEHIRFLAKAKALGSKLIVGLETDSRVKQIKGSQRPINNQQIRKEQLEALLAVDEVHFLPEKFSTQADWEAYIQMQHPDVYAVSSNTSFQENKRLICDKFDVDLRVVHEYNPEISTTRIINAALAEKS